MNKTDLTRTNKPVNPIMEPEDKETSLLAKKQAAIEKDLKSAQDFNKGMDSVRKEVEASLQTTGDKKPSKSVKMPASFAPPKPTSIIPKPIEFKTKAPLQTQESKSNKGKIVHKGIKNVQCTELPKDPAAKGRLLLVDKDNEIPAEIKESLNIVVK